MKKVLTLILCLAMTLTMMPSMVFAGDNTVAKIGDKEYTSLQTAIDAAGQNGVGTDIELVDDAEGPITINKAVTLSGSHKITSTNGHGIVITASDVKISGISIEATDGYGIQAYADPNGASITGIELSNLDITADKGAVFFNHAEGTVSETNILRGDWGGVEVDNNGKVNIAAGATIETNPNVPAVWADNTTENAGVITFADGTFETERVTGNGGATPSADHEQILYYTDLEYAIGQAADGDELCLLKDVPDAEGISVPSGKNFTLDFGGHVYTLIGPGAGSTGTETNGFQLLQNSNITFKNGTIRIAENVNGIKRIIQSYADLTLENMQIYAENQVGGEDYALSFNNGNVVFKGNTSVITSSADTIAFDVCYWEAGGYENVSVTFDESYTGTVNGTIIYDSADKEKAELSIAGSGTFGSIKLSADTTKGQSISVSGGTFKEQIPESFLAGGTDVYKKADGTFAVAPETPEGQTPSIDPTPGYHWEKDENGNYVEVANPYIPPTPTTQNPTIEADANATVALSSYGTIATITVAEGYELADVVLNGKSLGKVTTVTGLKTGDKLVVTTQKVVDPDDQEAEKNARLKKGVENTTIKLSSTLGKGFIKLNWKKSLGYKVDYYEVYKSTKRYSGYGTEPYYATKQGGITGWYKNTKELKKGTRYYYKVRGVRDIAGETVYTQWSTKAWRLVK